MKLLMITQRIDKGDDILGVYHEWVREIAGNFEKLSVICLYEGINELPRDIRVFSLGKETRKSRLQYLRRFFVYIWKLRNDYDVVFVHMTPVYVLLGWLMWRVSGKKIFLFYAHYKTGMLLRIASLFCKNILTSVPGSCGLKSKKVIAIGQGIDTKRFSGNIEETRQENSLLFVGRISPVKNLDVLIDAMHILTTQGENIHLTIVGGKDYGEEGYLSSIKEKIGFYNLDKFITFQGKASNDNMPDIYSRYEIYINLTQTGSFDKTILEAMSSGCIPIVSNELYRNIFPQDLHDLLIFKHNDANHLADNIRKAMKISYEEKIKIGNKMRDIVVKGHSLSTLGERLYKVFKSNA